MQQGMTMLAAGLLSLTGFWLVRRAWLAGRAGAHGRRQGFRLAGWGLLVIAAWPWMAAAGADRGVAFAVLMPLLFACVWLAGIGWREAQRWRGRRERDKPLAETARAQGARVLLRRIWIFLLAGPLSAACAFFLTVLLYGQAAHWQPANRLAAVLLCAPLVWTLLSIWSTYDKRLFARSAAVLVLLAIGVAGVLLNHGVSA